MRRLNNLPRLLLNLSYRIQLGLVVLSFLICVTLFAFGFPSPLDGSLLSIPVALAVWLFKRHGAFISLGSTILAMIIVNTITLHTILWSPAITKAFVAGVFALLAEALVIGYLRNSLDLSDVARLKAQQAEQQTALAYEQQRQLNQLKDQFILNVSHELRTPLTEMQGYLELLHEYHGQLDFAMQTTFQDNAIRACEELQLLIGNVLDAIQIGKREEITNIKELVVMQEVTEVLQLFDPRKQEEHSIQLDIPEELTVLANKQHLRQVLRNLLANAFKYSPVNTLLVISAIPASITPAHETGASSFVCISIKDAGPGIPPAEIPLLFGKFVRLKRDLSGPVRGSGLGLYICKQLVEGMGGSIWVESEGIAGLGSRFCFTVPSAAGIEATSGEQVSLFEVK